MQRLRAWTNQLLARETKPVAGDRLRMVDNRTSKIYEIPIKQSKDCYFIESNEINKVRNELNEPLRIYDSGYKDTICCSSKISFIDGIRGVLEYRGYRIQHLAEKSTFLEVAFLLIYGDLPSADQLSQFSQKIGENNTVHQDALKMMKSFRYDAHPMGMLISTLTAYSTLKPDANPSISGYNIYNDVSFRNKQIYSLLGMIPTLAANAFRHRMGKQFNLPHEEYGYTQNLLYMLDRLNEKEFKPHPKLTRALEVLFIIHAEHEVNCSTSFMRHLASSGVDIYTAVGLAAGALYGPKHGGANTAVIKMLESIGKKDRIRRFLMEVKLKKRTLYGFGNRVYKNYDPRAKIIKKIAIDVFEVCGKEPLIEIALQLERTALQDDYFITRKLYPNVDFYSGLIYSAIGFPTHMFPVLYTIPRVAGWLAHWEEFQNQQQKEIYQPRQNYTGSGRRSFVEMSERKQSNIDMECSESKKGRRREAAFRYYQQNKQ